MIPYIAIAVAAFIAISHFGRFWKPWAIISAIATVYELSAGAYVHCLTLGVPFTKYLAIILTPRFSETAAVTGLGISLRTLAIFAVIYWLVRIAGKLPSKTNKWEIYRTQSEGSDRDKAKSHPRQ